MSFSSLKLRLNEDLTVTGEKEFIFYLLSQKTVTEQKEFKE